MSSGDDRTHHWLLTSPGPGAGSLEDESMLHDDPDHQDDPSADIVSNSCGDPSSLMPYGCSNTEEGLSNSPVTSIDLDRDSPMGVGMDDDDDDPGPPSIETQPPDQGDDLEVSGITSTWINSGGSQYGSSSSHHPGLGYSLLNSQMPGDTADSTGLSQMPGLGPEDFGIGPPVYGPEMPPNVPFNSPLHETDVQHSYGDILDENGVSGLCGLLNLGNTCFMAAGIQCLVNTPPIAQYFFTHQHDNQQSLDTLAGRFSQLTHKIWSGKYSAVRPADFKDSFGMQWRDFRDYRQHDCQEFVTLLLEALRKQMCVLDDGGGGGGSFLHTSHKDNSLHNMDNKAMASCSSSSSSSNSNINNSNSSSSIGALTEAAECSNQHLRNLYSSSPSSPQSSVMCPTSPNTLRGPSSPHILKQTLDLRTDTHEESKDLDSGAASPKSSVSSSSTDAHLVNFRLQPIPEEVRQALIPRAAATHTSCDDLSLGTTSCADAESVTSDVSDPADVNGTVSSGGNLRRYNQLGNRDSCDSSHCDSSTPTQNLVSFHGLDNDHCDSSSSVRLEKNQLNSMRFGVSSGLEKSDRDNEFAIGPSSPGGSSNASSNSHLSMVKLEDIMKESKTSNVNVLVKENPTNNEFLYDSEKYAKYEKTRLKNSVDNLSKSGNKRVKEVNLLHEKRECYSSGLDLQIHSQDHSDDHLGLNKRIRLDEKNLHYELEKNCGGSNVESSVSGSVGEGSRVAPVTSISSAESHQAMDSWRTFVGDTQSTIVDTFYGQFKSSLVCSVCSHTSVKYDPFGTLSVPLPYANQIQLSVTYVPSDGSTPTRYLVTLCKVSYVSDLKSGLCNLIGDEDLENFVTAEVFDNHIARIVEDSYMTKFLNHTIRSIYAFQLNKQPPSAQEDLESQGEGSSSEGGATGENSDAGGGSLWRPCNICLDEMCQTELRTHNSCEDCLLCDTCIEMSCKHHGGSTLPCPVCQVSLSPSELIPVEKRRTEKPKARLLRVPLVFRLDQDGSNNNQRCMQLLGHPGLLALPSRVTPATLLRTIASRIPQNTQYTLLLVDGRGYNCSRCLFSSHCRGCEVLTDTKEISLQAGDTLCVRFTSLNAEQIHSLSDAAEHPSLGDLRQNVPLTIYDCLRSFTQSETLEESECWFCPVCERKQPATKTISVWKYPPYLILHLERFLFHGTMSTKLDDKVIYPLDGLDVSDYVAGQADGTHTYNLYGVVCHTGVAQAGHYTAFARSPVTGDWHYFNDDTVTRQKPREEEFSTAYLLFYHKQGTSFDLPLPQRFAFVEDISSKSNLCNNSNITDDVVACSSTHSISNVDASRRLNTTQSEDDIIQQPVLQLNKLIENLNDTCGDTLSDTIETDDPMVMEE